MNRIQQGLWPAAACVAGAICAFPAQAGTTAHVGAFSEYVFRGVVADGGAAVQGGIDYAGDSGLLAGVWATNANKFGGTEFDVYAAYLYKISDTVMVDVGALYYFLTEDKEDLSINPERRDFDTLEWFGTLFAGPVKLQAYYSHDYLATRAEGYYYSGFYTHAINPTIAVTAQVGYTHGNGAEAIYGDSYTDYSITLAKTVSKGLVFSLAAIDTDIEDDYTFLGTKDDPKVLVSVKKTFPF
ncbi:TorF family putative porin [Panacagrimonas sp.]|uniref:TorF family putative porin n=1 Tax=Panacagrimonas sp. TaxID=2480088 RepID=UPI003B5303A4